jgi:hypothetical protein
MRQEPNWTWRTSDTGHWLMVSTPDQLVALLTEVALEHSELARLAGRPQGCLMGTAVPTPTVGSATESAFGMVPVDTMPGRFTND